MMAPGQYAAQLLGGTLEGEVGAVSRAFLDGGLLAAEIDELLPRLVGGAEVHSLAVERSGLAPTAHQQLDRQQLVDHIGGQRRPPVACDVDVPGMQGHFVQAQRQHSLGLGFAEEAFDLLLPGLARQRSYANQVIGFGFAKLGQHGGRLEGVEFIPDCLHLFLSHWRTALEPGGQEAQIDHRLRGHVGDDIVHAPVGVIGLLEPTVGIETLEVSFEAVELAALYVAKLFKCAGHELSLTARPKDYWEYRDASSVISGTAARARLTGQPAFAACACSTKPASSIPGTRPTVTSSILVIVGFPSTGRSVTVASVCTDSGGLPASARMLDRAIEKHAA